MSDIDDFASNVLERALARSKVLKETLGKPDVAADTSDCDDSPDDECGPLSENVDVVPTKPLSAIPAKLTMGPDSPARASGINSPLGNLNSQLSASPIRRTRLRALANTINNWDDDYTHHFTPQSRFNLNKPSSPQRKHAVTSSPKTVTASPKAMTFSPKTKTDTNDRVRIDVEPKTLFASLATSSPRCLLPSVDAETNHDRAVEQEARSSEHEIEETNLSHDSSLEQEISLDVVDDCDSSKNSELSDSFTYFNRQSDTESKSETKSAPKSEEGVTQRCVLDDSVITALEAQGYVHSPASAKLYFDYKNPEAKENNKVEPYQLPGPKKPASPVKRAASPVRPTPICSKTPSPAKNCSTVGDTGPRVVSLVRKQFEEVDKIDKPVPTAVKIDADRSRISVAKKTALFESMYQPAPVKEIDPTELSVAERKKLFEKGRVHATFSSSKPVTTSPTRTNVAVGRAPRPSMIPSMPLRDKLKMFEQGLNDDESDLSDDELENAPRSRNKQIKPDVVPKSVPPPPPMPRFARSVSPQRPMAPPALPTIHDGFESSEEDNTIIESPKTPSPRKEVSFCTSPTSPPRVISPSSGKRTMSPKAQYPGARDVKRIRVNDPKPGRIYPSLTDIDTTEAETDTDMEHGGRQAKHYDVERDESMESETSIVSGSSLGTYIERKAIQNSPLRSEHQPKFRPSEDFNASLACRQIDAFIDEALEGQDYSMDTICESSPVASSSPLKNTCPSPVNPVLSQNLVHTVSFYRRQQTLSTASPKVTLTPKRVIPPVESSPVHERTFSHEDHVNDMVKKLELEAQSQQRSMAQASKALSLCKATMEFSDSRENVECERILLISTNKHSALVNEIHRLKTEGILGRKMTHSPTKGDFAPSCKGTMTINEVAIQLKREFLARAMKGETVYHFIALVKYRNYLDASSLVSLGNGINSSHLHAGVLYFPNSFTIANLEPDFKVNVEIFVLETLREYLPHEAKYHIKNDKNKMTPKKHKGDSQSKFTHFQHSPAGPNAVQACKFKSIGNLSIDITTLQRCHWQFEKVSSTSPLEGSVSMKIQCNAEGGVNERGFLTMFQDISGYGDWHRRWCKLTSSELSYWMYPEDESNEPLGRIALRHCVTTRVGPVPRDVCARANTFLLVTTRSPHPGDKDTLVTSCHEDYTAVRHLISADTREERDLWCRQFNRSLANLRAWDPHAQSPDDKLF